MDALRLAGFEWRERHVELLVEMRFEETETLPVQYFRYGALDFMAQAVLVAVHEPHNRSHRLFGRTTAPLSCVNPRDEKLLEEVAEVPAGVIDFAGLVVATRQEHLVQFDGLSGIARRHHGVELFL
jgi:hypothetical protein